MAVPKRKTTPSRRGNRRSHHALKPINISYDKETGEPKLPHHASLVDGKYNGKAIFRSKKDRNTLRTEKANKAAEAAEAATPQQ